MQTLIARIILILIVFALPLPLAALEQPEIFVQMGQGRLNSVSFSPDGRYILSASVDKTVKIWEAATGRELRTFTGHSGEVKAAVFSRDGKYVFSAGDRTVKLWETGTGKEIRTFKDESNEVDYVNAVAISPNGRTLLAGHHNNLVFWDIASGAIIKRIPERSVHSISFSSDGRYVATGGVGSPVAIWDVQSGSRIRELVFPYVVKSVAFSPDNRSVLAAYFDKVGGKSVRYITLWSFANGKVAWTINTPVLEQAIFSPDGKQVLAVFDKGQLKLFDTATGREATTLASAEGSSADAVAFSPDGKHVVSGWTKGVIRLWDMETRKEIKTIRGYKKDVVSIAVSADGRHALSAGIDSLELWDMATGRQVRAFPLDLKNIGFTEDPQIAAFSPDGKHVLSGGRGLHLWDAAAGRKIRTFTGSPVKAVAFCPDGKCVLAKTLDKAGDIRLWNTADGKEIRTFADIKNRQYFSVAFSSDGRYVLAANTLNIKVWNAETGKDVNAFPEPGKGPSPWSVVFGHHGKQILFQEVSGPRLGLWNYETGARLKSFTTPDKSYMTTIAISPDGRYAVYGNRDNALRMLDTSTGDSIWTFRHGSTVTSAAFLHGGRQILSGSQDGTARLLDASSGREMARFISFTDGEWIVITPEGYFNASTNGAKHLSVRVGSNIYAIDQFYTRFYRPELVRLALEGKEVPKGETFVDILVKKPAPAVEIASPATGISIDRDSVSLSLKITDNGGGVGDVNVYLNGSKVANETRSVTIKGKASANEKVLSFTIPLISGRNEIRAVAFNRDNSMESNPATVSVTCRTVPRKPNLHALVIGINEYRNKSISLNYAVSDARAFADTLNKVAAPLFEKTVVEVLAAPEKTTKEAIIKAFNDIGSRISPNDLFVFYDASHGIVDVVDNEEQYFLLTSNVLLLSSRHIGKEAVGHKELAGLIGNIPAQKKLVILDTCNAGKGGKEIQIALLQQTRGLTDSTAVKLLQRAIGSAVFSASSDTQLALEGYKGHGLFTYVLLEGLRGKADIKKEGYVTVLGLADYVEEQVIRISEEVFNRQQTPTIQTGANFPIGKVKE